MPKTQSIYVLSKEAEGLKVKLDKILQKRRLIKTKLQQIEEERTSFGIMGSGFGISVDGGVRTPIQEKILLRIEKIQSEVNVIMEDLFALEDELSEAIPLLPETEQGIIIDRYMNGWSWDKIMKKYGYEHKHIFRLRNKALNTISKNLK